MIAFFLMLTACSSDVVLQGTLIGNPSKGKASLAQGDNVSYTSASGYANSGYYIRQNNTMNLQNEVLHSIDLTLDLLNPDMEIELLKGDWVGLGIDFPDGIQIEGTRDSGGSFSIQTPPLFVVLGNSETFTIDDSTYLIEIGKPGWIADADFEGFEEEQIVITNADPLSLYFQEQLDSTSGLYVDEDSNGELDDEERESGTVASGEDNDSTESLEAEIDETDFPDLENEEEWEEWDHGEFENPESEVENSGCGGENASLFLPFIGLVFVRRRKSIIRKASN